VEGVVYYELDECMYFVLDIPPLHQEQGVALLFGIDLSFFWKVEHLFVSEFIHQRRVDDQTSLTDEDDLRH